MVECIFCAIVEGRAPAEVVFEDGETLAFMDINPANPGHTLVIPKQHVRNIYDLDDEAAAAVMRATVRVARAIKKALQPDGMNLVQSNERAGGQEIFHFHMHIIPRWYGDGLRLARPSEVRRTMAIKEAAAKIRGEIAKEQD
ncbi:MAG: HIT family protein [Anaerolineales bacterium]|nr:HIT family protein [Anaerolineales bacterium]